MAKCLVLGANGFLGSHLVDSLLSAGHTVRAFDGFSSDKKLNLILERPSLEIVTADFFDTAALADALHDIEYVFHFISTTNPATSAEDPLIDVETNLKHSVELFKLCLEKGVKRIIFPSTGGAIYGRTAEKLFREDDLAEPISPYGIGKQAIEGYLRYFKTTHGLDYIVLRISNPYGERQNIVGTQGVIPIFLNKLDQGQPVTVFGDGSNIRDYIYVTDVTRMIAATFDGKHLHHVYNLGSQQPVSLIELMDKMEQASGQKFNVDHRPVRSTDVQASVIDVSRFRNEFGLKPKITIEEGIQKTWEYVKNTTKKSN